mmetsp:Transcript_19082/g.43442  ORF Transcript_19082/g.43442 Transcript_19082/m.43442 type:complete len:110 (+) Transcript_19082:627-956(+)
MHKLNLVEEAKCKDIIAEAFAVAFSSKFVLRSVVGSTFPLTKSITRLDLPMYENSASTDPSADRIWHRCFHGITNFNGGQSSRNRNNLIVMNTLIKYTASISYIITGCK